MPVVGVSGGSGSGKTTLAKLLHEKLGPERSVIIYQDSYYIDRSREFRGDGTVNFDHPDALDWDLMLSHLIDLKQGRSIELPVYDFATHSRLQKTIKVKPCEFVLVDGILIFHPKNLCKIFDFRIFVDCREPIRFERRLKRDVEERGRTPEGVLKQCQTTVLPMHTEFVEPTKRYAHQIISGEGDLLSSVDQLMGEIGSTR